MTEQELKDKIIADIIPIIETADEFMIIETMGEKPSAIKVAERITDALIAAGIVDKSDYASMKETAVRYKAEVSKAGTRVKEAEAEANRYEMLYKLQNRDMALAERRAHDAEHRAARAERAFSKLVHEMYEHGIRPMCDEKFFVESRLKDAEKELAEEGKE